MWREKKMYSEEHALHVVSPSPGVQIHVACRKVVKAFSTIAN